MFDWFQKFLQWFKLLFWKQELDLAIVGLQYSGKTTFTGNFECDIMPTIGFNMKKLVKGNVMIKIWDLGGQPRFRSMWERYCKGVNCIIFMIDVAEPSKFDSATLELHNLLSNQALKKIPLLVLGNKCDLNDSIPSREIIKRIKLDEIKDRTVTYYQISCKENKNIDVTLKWLLSQPKK